MYERVKKIMFYPGVWTDYLFSGISNKLRKKGLVSGKTVFAYACIIFLFGILSIIFSKLICDLLSIRFGHDLISHFIVALLVWVFTSFPVLHFSKEYEEENK